MQNKCVIQCRECGNLESIPASLEKVKDWLENKRNRPLIQDAFPELNNSFSNSERFEVVMLWR